MTGRVLLPIGDAAEAIDTLYPFYRVREEGFEAVVAGPEARTYHLVMHEIAPGWDITRSLKDTIHEIVDQWRSRLK